MSTQTLPSPLASPTFAELFTPKLVTVFREGYSFANFRSDLMAGLTVAIVALPLSMAIAIGSHATPAQGLYTSIVGGFLVTDRMLGMFARKPKPKKADGDGKGGAGK